MSIRSFLHYYIINSTGACLLGLLFMATSSEAAAVKKKITKHGIVHTMTVMEVQPPSKGVDTIYVSFRVSQRIYKLPTKSNTRYLKLLKESEKKHTPVKVWRIKEESDVIIEVDKP